MTADRLALEVVPATRLQPSQRDEILALCDLAYDEQIAPYFANLEVHSHVLGRVDGALVSHTCWVTRYLQAGRAPVMRTAYVELVATHPAHQGRGYAAALMRHLVASVQDYDLAALSPTDAGAPLYERLGWQYWRGPLFVRGTHDLRHTPDERVMILPLPRTPHLDLNSALSAEWRPGELW